MIFHLVVTPGNLLLCPLDVLATDGVPGWSVCRRGGGGILFGGVIRHHHSQSVSKRPGNQTCIVQEECHQTVKSQCHFHLQRECSRLVFDHLKITKTTRIDLESIKGLPHSDHGSISRLTPKMMGPECPVIHLKWKLLSKISSLHIYILYYYTTILLYIYIILKATHRHLHNIITQIDIPNPNFIVCFIVTKFLFVL